MTLKNQWSDEVMLASRTLMVGTSPTITRKKPQEDDVKSSVAISASPGIG
jgi:hypothetical protein